ncbi:MAG: DNA primase [Nitrospiraceae bacterium]|nr:DNA primase [Nitrospiraceae bacterium]
MQSPGKKNLLEDVKSRLDIVSVIGDYVSLKKAGSNYSGLCPFHNEKTPSFMVNPEKQVFHCFGCGVGGDMAAFVMKYESMEFPEALKFLAVKAGLDPEEYSSGFDKRQADEKKDLKEIMAEACRFYSSALQKSQPALQYIKNRGISPESAKEFMLGYAPPEWGALAAHLARKGFSPEKIIRAGVSKKGQNGLFDMLRNRIVFPITDSYGAPVALGGRVMDASLPKYLNTPETALFKKGQTLYGMSLAKDAVRAEGNAILSEGNLDVIMCHQNGFKNVIAPMGTALTAAHMKFLKRYTSKIFLVFDGDNAGINAARRSLGIALEQEFEIKVALLPSGEDPDSLLRKSGASAFRLALDNALSPVEFVLKTFKGTRTEVLREAVHMVGLAADPIMKEELVRELADKGRTSEDAIRRELARVGQKRSYGGRPTGPDVSKTAEQKPAGPAGIRYKEEKLLLSIFYNQPDKRGAILKDMSSEELEDPVARGLFSKMARAEAFTAEEQAVLSALAVAPGFEPDDALAAASDCIKKLRVRAINKKMAEARGDAALLKKLIMQKKALTGGRTINGE